MQASKRLWFVLAFLCIHASGSIYQQRVLLLAEARSGSTLVGESLNRINGAFYLFEPCRSLEGSDGLMSFSTARHDPAQCASLARRLFTCSFTQEDLRLLLADRAAVFKSRVLHRLSLAHNATGGDSGTAGVHCAALAACRQARLIAIKEVRFGSPEAFDILDRARSNRSRAVATETVLSGSSNTGHDSGTSGVSLSSGQGGAVASLTVALARLGALSEVRVLHLVRHPLAVLNSRLHLPQFCGTEEDPGDLSSPSPPLFSPSPASSSVVQACAAHACGSMSSTLAALNELALQQQLRQLRQERQRSSERFNSDGAAGGGDSGGGGGGGRTPPAPVWPPPVWPLPSSLSSSPWGYMSLRYEDVVSEPVSVLGAVHRWALLENDGGSGSAISGSSSSSSSSSSNISGSRSCSSCCGDGSGNDTGTDKQNANPTTTRNRKRNETRRNGRRRKRRRRSGSGSVDDGSFDGQCVRGAGWCLDAATLRWIVTATHAPHQDGAFQTLRTDAKATAAAWMPTHPPPKTSIWNHKQRIGGVGDIGGGDGEGGSSVSSSSSGGGSGGSGGGLSWEEVEIGESECSSVMRALNYSVVFSPLNSSQRGSSSSSSSSFSSNDSEEDNETADSEVGQENEENGTEAVHQTQPTTANTQAPPPPHPPSLPRFYMYKGKPFLRWRPLVDCTAVAMAAASRLRSDDDADEAYSAAAAAAAAIANGKISQATAGRGGGGGGGGGGNRAGGGGGGLGWPWLESALEESTQNTGALWIHESLKAHPQRTFDPEEASLFVVPFDSFLSLAPTLAREAAERADAKRAEAPTTRAAVAAPSSTSATKIAAAASKCAMNRRSTQNGKVGKRGKEETTTTTTRAATMTHSSRSSALLAFLKKSKYWKRRGGRDHLLVGPWYGVARALKGPSHPSTAKWWGGGGEEGTAGGGGGAGAGEESAAAASATNTLWGLLAPQSLLATVDGFFSRPGSGEAGGVSEWNPRGVIVVPYVAHACLTTPRVRRWFDRHARRQHQHQHQHRHRHHQQEEEQKHALYSHGTINTTPTIVMTTTTTTDPVMTMMLAPHELLRWSLIPRIPSRLLPSNDHDMEKFSADDDDDDDDDVEDDDDGDGDGGGVGDDNDSDEDGGAMGAGSNNQLNPLRQQQRQQLRDIAVYFRGGMQHGSNCGMRMGSGGGDGDGDGDDGGDGEAELNEFNSHKRKKKKKKKKKKNEFVWARKAAMKVFSRMKGSRIIATDDDGDHIAIVGDGIGRTTSDNNININSNIDSNISSSSSSSNVGGGGIPTTLESRRRKRAARKAGATVTGFGTDSPGGDQGRDSPDGLGDPRWEYARELSRALFCLVARGDTSTSRRLFDAVAAGCVPVLVSDGVHLPFDADSEIGDTETADRPSINYSAFTVVVPEAVVLQHYHHQQRHRQAGNDNNRVKNEDEDEELVTDSILRMTPFILQAKQKALLQARQHLLYGFGSPLTPSPPQPPVPPSTSTLQKIFDNDVMKTTEIGAAYVAVAAAAEAEEKAVAAADTSEVGSSSEEEAVSAHAETEFKMHSSPSKLQGQHVKKTWRQMRGNSDTRCGPPYGGEGGSSDQGNDGTSPSLVVDHLLADAFARVLSSKKDTEKESGKTLEEEKTSVNGGVGGAAKVAGTGSQSKYKRLRDTFSGCIPPPGASNALGGTDQ